MTIITFDLDFGAILATTGADKPSVIQLRHLTLDPPAVATIAGTIRDAEADIEQGALVTIDIKTNRLRLLPLRPALDP